MEPQKFGRYEIKDELGRGGMATVYHAYDPRFEREVALKVLPREMLHDPQFRTRFEREAKTIAMLEHPAIVPVYDFGEEDGQPYFVMRYMTGGSLSDRMKKGPMSIPEVARLFDRLAPALDEAHAKGIIHRDLKPGNILFDQYGEPYVSDFGIAKITSGESNVTGSAIVGTPAYMSPEQAQGEGIDGRSDIYGLGVIIFELLTGQQPYHGDTPMSVVVKQITDPVPHILDVKPDLPPAMEGVIEKAMAKNRDERFPTVKALAEALDAVARGEAPDLASSAKTMLTSPKTVIARQPMQAGKTILSKGGEPIIPAAPPKRTGLWIGLGGIVVLLGIAVIAGLLIFRNKIPFLAAPTETVPIPQATNTKAVIPATSTSLSSSGLSTADKSTDTAVPSSTPNPSPTPTVPALPNIGGADQIAFLSNNDIWIMNSDGSNLVQATKDGTVKSDLQWSLDGQSLYYLSGQCIETLTISSGAVDKITCFTSAEFLDAFELSPDGTQVAISLNRVVYVVPFDLKAIKNAKNWTYLRDMNGCFTYGSSAGSNQAASKTVRWSNDGKKLAIDLRAVESGKLMEEVHLFNINPCNNPNPIALDNFPATRFSMVGYNAHPAFPNFSWDGDTLFVLNTMYRYDFGYMYVYNAGTHNGKQIDPLGSTCCYTEGRFSPDGSYLLFAYQDINNNTNPPQLYYIPFGTIGTGATYTPINLPAGFFQNPSNHLDAVFQKAKQ